jgi:hypothetical protein
VLVLVYDGEGESSYGLGAVKECIVFTDQRPCYGRNCLPRPRIRVGDRSRLNFSNCFKSFKTIFD